MNQVRASHIQVDTEEQARLLLEQLRQGRTFEELAAVYSKCPSGRDGGDLGWFSRGMMLPAFERVCFAMEDGELAGPVRTEMGVHLIKLTGKKVSKLRVLITSDLHFELTGPEPIRRLVAGMDRENPDLVVLAGDLGHPSRLFAECLRCFLKLNCPVAVLPGNQDLWTSPGETSILLYEEILGQVTREHGFHWLEKGPFLLDNGTAVCGTIGWYDYSSCDPSLSLTPEQIAAEKCRFLPDNQRLDWEYKDPDFAELCRRRLRRTLTELEDNERVDRILVVSHVPCFESQLEKDSADPEWCLASAFFGHLTLGECLRGFPKVRWAVSGHTHMGLNGLVERPGGAPIATAVVGSDYGRPRWVTLEI